MFQYDSDDNYDDMFQYDSGDNYDDSMIVMIIMMICFIMIVIMMICFSMIVMMMIVFFRMIDDDDGDLFQNDIDDDFYH